MRLRSTRLLALGAIVVAGVLYWKPLHSYMHTRDVLNRREAEVAKLQQQQDRLEARIERPARVTCSCARRGGSGS